MYLLPSERTISSEVMSAAHWIGLHVTDSRTKTWLLVIGHCKSNQTATHLQFFMADQQYPIVFLDYFVKIDLTWGISVLNFICTRISVSLFLLSTWSKDRSSSPRIICLSQVAIALATIWCRLFLKLAAALGSNFAGVSRHCQTRLRHVLILTSHS